MLVAALSAKSGHGKDFCAQIFVELAQERGYNFGRFAFAWPLKARAYAEGALTGTLTWDDIKAKPPAVRKLLQEVGTERGREVFGEDFWTLQAEGFLQLMDESDDLDGVVISDCRFPNEVDFARLGGRAPSLVRKNMLAEVACWYHKGGDEECYQYELRESGGLALWIDSDRPTLTGEAALHLSETALDALNKDIAFDGRITNDCSTTVADLRRQLAPFVDDLLAKL